MRRKGFPAFGKAFFVMRHPRPALPASPRPHARQSIPCPFAGDPRPNASGVFTLPSRFHRNALPPPEAVEQPGTTENQPSTTAPHPCKPPTPRGIPRNRDQSLQELPLYPPGKPPAPSREDTSGTPVTRHQKTASHSRNPEILREKPTQKTPAHCCAGVLLSEYGDVTPPSSPLSWQLRPSWRSSPRRPPWRSSARPVRPGRPAWSSRPKR